jgi:hypothetical protein
MSDQQPRRQRKSRMYSSLHDSLYGESQQIPFSPNAPTPAVAPAAGRATPYIEPPQECFMSLRTGAVTCLNQQRAYLDGAPSYATTIGQGQQSQAQNNHGHGQKGQGQGPTGFPGGYPGRYPGHVYGSEIVDQRADSPLNRLLTRGPVGPWNLVGYAVTDSPGTSSSRDKSMLVYAQRIDRGRDRYNYRITDSNNVPMDVGESVHWKSEGETIHVPGQPSDFTLHVYESFR